MSERRLIVHVDMDAFFAAIEQRDNPDLRGKPVVIGADPRKGRGRGVVSTSSYEARKFGIHSAMPISTAYRRCPNAIFLPVNMKKYSSVSREVYKIFYDFTPDVEPISIDEAFLDISGSFHLFGTPHKTCQLIKSRIKKETGLTASVGLAPIKMAAKIASDLEKPDGLVEVAEGRLLDFLWPLDIRKLWGLGSKSEGVFRRMGINTIGDLARRSVNELREVFGKNGVHLWQLANGVDDRSVEGDVEVKSISNETTFNEDTLEAEKIESALMFLSEKVSSRLRHDRLKGRTVTLKIRLKGFHTYTRASTLPGATNFADVLYKEIKKLYNSFNKKGRKVRLVGVKVSNLSCTDLNESLFEPGADRKREEVHKAIDRIRGRFGDASIQRAGQMR